MGSRGDDKAELCLVLRFAAWLRALVQIYLVVTVLFAATSVGGGVRVMHHFLPFVCFALY